MGEKSIRLGVDIQAHIGYQVQMPANHCIPHSAAAKLKMSLARKGKPCLSRRRESMMVDGLQFFHCGRCGKFFPRSGFYKNKRTILGMTSECRKCHSEVSIATRNPERTKRRRIKDEANRRARTQGRKISGSDYLLLTKILGRKCQHCGNTESLQWDHVLPLASGGLHHPSNIQRLCRKCNERKQKSCTEFRTD